MTSLRIDTAVQPASYIRLLLYAGLMSVMLILAWFASLAWWQYLLILMVSVGIVIYLRVSRPALSHLSQPPLSQRADKDWQLLIQTGRGDELWQARLLSIHHYQWVIHFEFDVIEPYQRSLPATIFRDQVSRDEWRELSVLASMMNH